MIRPLQAHDVLLTDIAKARSETERLHLWWLGQSGFLVQWQGRHLLLDPYLSDSLTRKYAGTDKPHVRMTELAVTPERLNFIDVVTSSHAHTDHLDAETLQPLGRANRDLRLVFPAANRALVAERSDLPAERLLGVNARKPTASPQAAVESEIVPSVARIAGFEVHAVPAAHEALEVDAHGHHWYLGYLIKAGPFTIYHSGDTVLYDGMAEWLRPFHVDVALLPINGRAPERRVAGNLDAHAAAGLAQAMGARVAIPCHFEMFEFNTASPEEFQAACVRLGQRCRVLRCGERWSWPG